MNWKRITVFSFFFFKLLSQLLYINNIRIVIIFKFSASSCFFALGCWESDPHRRPTFEEILDALNEILHSSFMQTPHESFHIMQDDWRQEIEEVLLELRRKEKVTYPKFTLSLKKKANSFTLLSFLLCSAACSSGV